MARLGSGLMVAALLLAGAPAFAGDSVLPFGKSLAGGEELPLPFGVGLTVYGQTQDYGLKKLAFDFPGLSVDPGVIGVDNSIQEMNIQLDVWIFPFLNLFGILGSVDGITNVDLSGVQGLPFSLGRLRIDYDGEVYGVGANLVAGGQGWFASLTTIWTQENLSGDFESDVQAWIITPRLGLRDDRGAVWIGATYQDVEETHQGTIVLPFVGPVAFDVELEAKDAWNIQIGAATEISKHWHLHVEGGFAQRLSAEFGATARF